MKGLTHVGAWRALQEAGIVVDEIVGTSIGGLVGALIAAGEGPETLAARALALRRTDIVALNRWAVLLNGVRQPSVFHDVPFREYIARLLPVRTFGELRLPFSMNAVDLGSGEMVWFGTGGRQDVPLEDAVYATCALPLFFPPATIDDRLYVDGGVLDTLPLARAAERGATRIIAIDAGAEGSPSPATILENGLVGIHQRVYQLMATQWKQRQLEDWAGPPVTFVRPRLEGYGTFDFEQTAYFLEEGYRATRAVLESEGHTFGAREREA
jgi:NTE family protein